MKGAAKFEMRVEGQEDYERVHEGIRREFEKTIEEIAAKVQKGVMRHRERYLKAWVAATGLSPLDAELIEEVYPLQEDGVIRTRVYVVPRRKM